LCSVGEETPIDYKKSPADSAIDRRQRSKAEKGRNASSGTGHDSPSEQTEISKVAEGSRKSVTQRVNNRRHDKAHVEAEEEDSHINDNGPNDPVDWS
jgi:hypothetical protein